MDYPSWETLPHERLTPRTDTVGRRLAVLRRLAHPRADDPETGPVSVVVAPVRSVLQPQVKGLGDLEPVSLTTGQTADLGEVVDALAAAAYARVELVEKRGEFAVRGGILEAFPPTEEHPLRIEFWGDEVEEIRYFKVADQRSLEVAEHGLWAPPCRELLLTEDVRSRARDLAEPHPELGELLGRIAEGIAVEGMESLAPVLVDDMELLLDVLPKGSMAVVCDPERVRTRCLRPRGHEPGVPAGVLGGDRGRRRGPDRCRRGLPVVHRGRPGAGARAGHDVVVRVAVRGGRDVHIRH
ncbi:Transcription-repair-coupling factor [Streptomyces alboniger]